MNKRTYLLFAVVLLFGIVGMNILIGSSTIFWLLVIPAVSTGLFAWALPVILERVNATVWISSGLLILLGLLFPTSLLMSGFESGPFSSLTGTALFLLPSLALINAAFLLFAGLHRVDSNLAGTISLPLSVLLIVRTLQNMYELTRWDNTYDPLGYLWLILPVFAVLLSGLMLSISLPVGMKIAGPAFTILVTVLLIGVSTLAQRVDFRQETVKRAERTVQAVESYYASNGSYPESLSQLTPLYILSVPKPMIIHGQGWCYEGDEGYYRLGYIDREHWSDPNLIGRVHDSVGDVPDQPPICMDEFTAIQSRDPGYPYDYSMEGE